MFLASATDHAIRRAKAGQIELQTAERAKKLLALEVAINSLDTIVGAFRSEFGALGARITRDLALRRQIDAEVADVLGCVADRLEVEAERLEAG